MKRFLPALVALGVFVIVATIMCKPGFSGMKLKSHDYESWQCMAQQVLEDYKANGNKGDYYWSGAMFSGMPSYIFAGGDNPNFLHDLQYKISKTIPRPWLGLMICLIGFYVFARSMRWNNWVSIFGAIAFAFSSYNIIIGAVGHDTKLFCIGYAIGTLGGIQYVFDGRKWLGILVFTLSFLMLLSNSHIQIIYYFLLMVLAYGAFHLINAVKEKRAPDFFKQLGLLVLLGIGASLPSLKNLILVKTYDKYSIRGAQPLISDSSNLGAKKDGLSRDYAFQWSNGIMESFSVLLPRINGGSSSEEFKNGKTADFLLSAGGNDEMVDNFTKHLPLYFGPQPFLSGSVYFGAIIVFLFILSFFVVKSNLKWWFLGLCVLGFMMSWGKNFPAFNNFLFDNLPFYNKFRTPSMALVLPQILFVVLGTWALNTLFTEEIDKKQLWKGVQTAGIITLGIVLVLGVFGSAFLNFKGAEDAESVQRYAQMFGGDNAKAEQLFSAIRQDRAGANQSDALRSGLFILLAIGLIWAVLKDKLKKNYAILGIGLLITVDLVSFGFRYLNEENFEEKTEAEYAPPIRQVDAQILKDTDPNYRVMDMTRNPFNDATSSFYHKTVGGYSPAKLRVYQDLIENALGQNNSAAYNMLNTKYFILGQPGQEQIMPNRNALGNAWFVSAIKEVPDAMAEMKAIQTAPSLSDTAAPKANAFNPKIEAIVQKQFMPEIGNTNFVVDSGAQIKLDKYGIMDLSYTSNNSKDGYAVFSEIYYPESWKAFVDGKETPITKCNYVLRGIKIPAGNHKITFKVESKMAKLGDTLANIGNIFILLLVAGSLWMLYKNNKTGA